MVQLYRVQLHREQLYRVQFYKVQLHKVQLYRVQLLLATQPVAAVVSRCVDHVSQLFNVSKVRVC